MQRFKFTPFWQLTRWGFLAEALWPQIGCDEPFEMDSDCYPQDGFDCDVRSKVEAILAMEKMKKEKDKHGIFHR